MYSVENLLKLAQSWYGPLCFQSSVKKPVYATLGSGTPSVLLQCGGRREDYLNACDLQLTAFLVCQDF